ncbi:MAG: ShlB/FhaC/HecB family hemolysin secretion/activation protein [Xenococcaceae cyanobacterium MO_207.B15]|nr:ShlB/FhaC/HecB family hemolysin secretion/activation protein [Xenococcaceae cyanobacterium MO_207.B15]
MRTPTQELAFGFTASRRNSEVIFAPGGEQLGFPSPGANEDGEIRVTALRFFQEYISRNNREVFALRSQFNLGIGAFDATINPDPEPDSRFFSWQGQAQWVLLLGDDSRLLLRGSMQLASTSLVSLEQYGIGGIDSVRGYRQDRLLADNGAFASVEVQIPLFRLAQNSVVQIAPFADVGVVWNVEQEIPESNTLASIGLGLRWSIGDRFSARFDWGIPLIAVTKSTETTWQENGLYFSIQYNPF